MSTEPRVNAEYIAQHLGVAKDTVYHWREPKGLPVHRVGRCGNSSSPRWMNGYVQAVRMKMSVSREAGIHELHGIPLPEQRQ